MAPFPHQPSPPRLTARWVLPAGALLLAALWLTACQRPEASPPDIVLITLDTTRADHLGCYGYERDTTPHLDRLAREAVLFTRAYSTSSWTLPAHASLFTAKLPTSHGARYDPDGPLQLTRAIEGPEMWDAFRARGLHPGATTLAARLAENGYATAAVVGGPWMKRIFGLDRGFAFYDDRGISHLNGRPATEVTNTALDWLESASRRPFFLFLNYFDVHTPYTPPERYKKLFLPPDAEPRSPEWRQALYDAELRYLDDQIGRLLDGLEARGLFEESWIVLTSDHGELLGEGDRFGHGATLTEAEIHIPLLIKYPASSGRAGRVELPVQITDILPTLLAAAGIENPEHIQGEALPEVGHPIVAEVFPLAPFQRGGDWRAIVQGDLKYAIGSHGDELLVDVSNDPAESSDLREARPETAQALRAELDHYLASLPTAPDPGPEQEIDEETRRALESLGYLE